jgi:hypothetical protein
MLLVQMLESRTLFAADPTFQLTAKGTLIVRGGAASDEIIVQLKHGKAADGVQVLVTLDKPTGSSPPQEYDSTYKKIKRYYIDAGAGDDFINIAGGSQMTRPATILGGAGNDTLGFSPDAPTLVAGGAGNDQVVGTPPSVEATSSKNRDVLDATFATSNSSSSATLLGGAGDDTISGDTNDQIDGGAGNDTAKLLIYGNISDDRRNALAADYYARLNANSVEQLTGEAAPDDLPVLSG